jgi:hypothetical protein
MQDFPENSDIAFEEALRVGAHGLETGTPVPTTRLTRDRRRPHVIGRHRRDLP